MTVLSFCFFTYAKENPGIIFCAMNYSVHAVMYTYYCAMAMRRVSALTQWVRCGCRGEGVLGKK